MKQRWLHALGIIPSSSTSLFSKKPKPYSRRNNRVQWAATFTEQLRGGRWVDVVFFFFPLQGRPLKGSWKCFVCLFLWAYSPNFYLNVQSPNKSFSGREAEGHIRDCLPNISLREQVGRKRMENSRNGRNNAPWPGTELPGRIIHLSVVLRSQNFEGQSV